MSDEDFSFTPEQKANLEKWKAFLDSKRAKEWAIEEGDAIKSIHNTFNQARFEEGNDLTSDELDDVFRKMKILINNMTLARNLYDNNGLANFNSRLRRLFFSSEPLAERINQFIELNGVAKLTVSQFLCALSPTKYPEVGWATLDVLDLDSVQLDNAYRQALREHNISSPQNYRGDTIEYLRDMIIFREINNLLSIEDYNLINDLLWLAFKEVETEVKPGITSVGLETDLIDRLAENPSSIERGLSLIGKEYPIPGAGRADLVCKDNRGNYVVIETKKGGESDRVVGQILRYIGGLKREGKRARGIIVVNEPDARLDFAIEAVQDFVKLKYYKVKFTITDSYTNS